MIGRPAAEVNAGRQRLFWGSLDGLQLMSGATEAVDDLSSAGAGIRRRRQLAAVSNTCSSVVV